MGTDFPVQPPTNDNPFAPGRPLSSTQGLNNGLPTAPGSGNDGGRYYTIQRVNGNGANGKGDGTAGVHKHTIEESDKVKKSSIHRHFLKEEKERRKSMVSDQFIQLDGNSITGSKTSRRHDTGSTFRIGFTPSPLDVIEVKNHWISFPLPASRFHFLSQILFKNFYGSPLHRNLVLLTVAFVLLIYCKLHFTSRTMSDNANSEKKTYHKKATGIALNTVKKHSKDHELKLYGSCFW